jgi:bla regulator protein BlaR1
MHELTHLKNKDIFINWVINLLSMVYWFNPILLYGFHKMKQDCEYLCDNQVISYLDVGGNQQYGNALIRVLEIVSSSNRLIGTTPMVMNSCEIKRRIIMISKYKKNNIKGILLGTVAFVIIGCLGIALNISNVNSNKNITKATTLQAKTPITAPKSPVNNASIESASSNIKNSSNDSTNSIVPFLSNIVIYNSHPNEVYPSGMRATDVGALLNDKLVKEGLNSHFIKVGQNTDYNKSFQITRDIITKNVKEYSNTILLDIHLNTTEKDKSDARKILFILTKESPNYDSNKKFVDSLFANIKNSNQVKPEIYFYKFGISYYNQDLSNNSTLVDLGNNMSSDSDIEACVNALVSAIKNNQKNLTK